MNDIPMNLPNLIIPGAMKCGTTSLYNYINLHPEVRMSDLKEPDFFVDTWENLWDLGMPQGQWNRGLDWYCSHFTGTVHIRGEATVNYSKFPHIKGVPQRMYSIIPKARLIYIVRNPIERILSHYVHYIAEGWGRKSLEKLLGDCNNNYYVNCSRYFMQIEQFLEYYPRRQLLVIKFEELVMNRTETLRAVFNFLEVDETFSHPDFYRVHHPTRKVRLTPLGEYLEENIDENPELSPIVRHIKQTKPHLIGTPVEKPVVSPELRQKLLDALYDDIKNLESLMEWDLSGWYT